MLSDEARSLSHDEPDIFKAAIKEFKGKFSYIPLPIPFSSISNSITLSNYLLIFILTSELPKDSHLDDMANLLNLDS